MAYIELTFSKQLITDLFINTGDTVFYSNPTTANGFDTSSDNTLIGSVDSISVVGDNAVVKVECDMSVVPPSENSFIFFSKNNVVNISSLKGYYGLVEFRNNSSSPIELFSVGCDIAESSK